MKITLVTTPNLTNLFFFDIILKTGFHFLRFSSNFDVIFVLTRTSLFFRIVILFSIEFSCCINIWISSLFAQLIKHSRIIDSPIIFAKLFDYLNTVTY